MSATIENGEEINDVELWDHYSGLPNPLWYKYIKEHPENGEEGTSDSVDISTVDK
jgi:hypothetical protein